MSYRITRSPGLSLICVSLAVSILTMPLYRRADAIQEKERNKKRQMEKWVSHIQKHFKGDERVMMLNTYYRQQNYKPIYALRSSLSLLLQIPFFIAAYRYLSGLLALRGASFLWISDLGAPDQLFTIGSFSVNLMPVLMTLVNILSGMVYAKDFPFKEKLQLYGIALVFLVLLYRSPSGLVFYWTMNNVFSLIKNIYKKYVRLPRGINIFLIPAVVCLFMLALLLTGKVNTVQRGLLTLLVIAASFMPLITALWLSEERKRKKARKRQEAVPGCKKEDNDHFCPFRSLFDTACRFIDSVRCHRRKPRRICRPARLSQPLVFHGLDNSCCRGILPSVGRGVILSCFAGQEEELLFGSLERFCARSGRLSVFREKPRHGFHQSCV